MEPISDLAHTKVRTILYLKLLGLVEFALIAIRFFLYSLLVTS